MTDNLPDKIQPPELPGLEITLPEPLSENSKIEDAIRVDVGIANQMVEVLMYGFAKEDLSVNALTRLSLSTLQALKYRRELMNLQYGNQSADGKSKVLDPID